LQSNSDALVAAGQVEILYERSQPRNPLDNFDTAVREFYLGSLCIRKEVFERLGPFHTGIGYADDTDFLMRRREANIKTTYVDGVTLQSRLHETNPSFYRSVTTAHLLAALRESLRLQYLVLPERHQRPFDGRASGVAATAAHERGPAAR